MSTCGQCGGLGEVQDMEIRQHGRYQMEWAPCRDCACPGHQRVGRCYHRAYAVWLADVQGVDVTRIPTIGVSKRGLPRTFGRKLATKGVAS